MKKSGLLVDRLRPKDVVLWMLLRHPVVAANSDARLIFGVAALVLLTAYGFRTYLGVILIPMFMLFHYTLRVQPILALVRDPSSCLRSDELRFGQIPPEDYFDCFDAVAKIGSLAVVAEFLFAMALTIPAFQYGFLGVGKPYWGFMLYLMAVKVFLSIVLSLLLANWGYWFAINRRQLGGHVMVPVYFAAIVIPLVSTLAGFIGIIVAFYLWGVERMLCYHRTAPEFALSWV